MVAKVKQAKKSKTMKPRKSGKKHSKTMKSKKGGKKHSKTMKSKKGKKKNSKKKTMKGGFVSVIKEALVPLLFTAAVVKKGKSKTRSRK